MIHSLSALTRGSAACTLGTQIFGKGNAMTIIPSNVTSAVAQPLQQLFLSGTSDKNSLNPTPAHAADQEEKHGYRGPIFMGLNFVDFDFMGLLLQMEKERNPGLSISELANARLDVRLGDLKIN
jgi:hypothetical protein